MARKRKILKPVRCTVRFIAGGTCRKTVKRQITMAQALREIGGDPVGTEGRLLTGVPLNKSRVIVRGVRVVLQYVADHRPRALADDGPHVVAAGMDMDLQAAVGVIRNGVYV